MDSTMMFFQLDCCTGEPRTKEQLDALWAELRVVAEKHDYKARSMSDLDGQKCFILAMLGYEIQDRIREERSIRD